MVKPGYKTTEFYVSLLAGVLVAVNAVPTPHDARGYIVAAVAALYAVSRGLAKIGAGEDPTITPAPVADTENVWPETAPPAGTPAAPPAGGPPQGPTAP